MRRRRLFVLAGALTAAAPAYAQGTVTSAGPQSVDVTVYRDPNRSADQQLDLDWLNGYALVSETRTITLPAGESEVRFEGVAGGILPQSAIVTGFPEGVVEKNRDAYLLSPGSLIERSLGRRVTLRRTSRATGQVREEEAVIRSGADGAVVLQTPAGFEALRCTGQNETLVYPQVPPGLSSRPTLSVRTRSAAPVTATVTLSYLASGFDWQANYIAELSPDETHVDLFAWLTLASTDETSFRDADVAAVAGRINHEEIEPEPAETQPINLTCWPAGTTSGAVRGISTVQDAIQSMASNNGLAAPAPMAAEEGGDQIIVTGTAVRGRRATQEELGDVKLYRLPVPVTVAANSQKQVALLIQPRVAVQVAYRQRLNPFYAGTEPVAATRTLVSRNRTADGLGLALPAGGVALFTTAGRRRLLIGEGHLDDRAVGEDVEIELDRAAGVRTTARMVGKADAADSFLLEVTNDQSRPIRYELELDTGGQDALLDPAVRLGRRDGRPLWAVTVPANGRATLRYRLRHSQN